MYRKTILLTEIIAPYRIPVFNKIAELYNGEFLVIFLAKTVVGRSWKIDTEKIHFNYEVAKGFVFKRLNSDFFPYLFNPFVFLRLIKLSPDVIIVGSYQHPTYFLALFYAKLFKKKFILWCESHGYGITKYNCITNSLKKFFIRKCDGYIVPGEAAYEYILSFGVKSDRIWKAPNAIDNDFFTQTCDKYRDRKEAFKQSKNYPDKIVLYVGRLIDQKGIWDLLKSFRVLSEEYLNIGLILIGTGKGKEQYRKFCKTNNMKNVFYEGFVQQEQLPVYYAVADVFVLPAHSDPWGLVLNEAMSCGLPVISSDVAGATFDLIYPGVNGYIFRRGDVEELTNYLKDILSDEEKRIRMGQSSSDIISDYSPLKCAQGFIQAIEEIQKAG